MAAILILFYMLILICGVLALVFDVYAWKKNKTVQSAYQAYLRKIFETLNIPFAVFCLLASLISMYIYQEDGATLMVLCFCIITGFLTSLGRWFFWTKTVFSRAGGNTGAVHPALEKINTFYALKSNTEKIFLTIAEKTNTLLDSIARHNETIHSACAHIDEFIGLQKSDCVTLIEKRKQCEALFETMSQAARQFTLSFNAFIEKINASNASALYAANSEELLSGIRTSFQEAYSRQSEMVREEINQITNKLNIIGFKYNQFPAVFKLYNTQISNYSSRMESALEAVASPQSETLSLEDMLAKWKERGAGQNVELR